MTNARGLDVSDWQGSFDWRGHPDINFAAAKAYEAGVGEDPQFAANWSDMWTTFGGKIPRIAYCYGHPADSVSAQATTLVQLVRDHRLMLGDHFALDMEAGPGESTPDGLPAAEVARWSAEFSHLVNKAALLHRCFGYCSADVTWGWGLWPAWTADWGVSTPRVAAPWKTWHIWQVSGTGTDLDQWNGDKAQMLDFCRMPTDRR